MKVKRRDDLVSGVAFVLFLLLVLFAILANPAPADEVTDDIAEAVRKDLEEGRKAFEGSQPAPVWLVLMILDAGSGEVLQEAVVLKFDAPEACTSEQAERGVRRPVDGLLAIYDCRQMVRPDGRT